ncbi:hypothetical protein, partial [Mesorhizobium sp. M7A.F.Ca.CA.002.05.1.1]|uniref:hypothetical protein n=1 Tax=Mesorhizobium sp. M7A.F.Ca.CA.002.05.1.1 TaxID=2496704 RepID=UPI0019D0B9D1
GSLKFHVEPPPTWSTYVWKEGDVQGDTLQIMCKTRICRDASCSSALTTPSNHELIGFMEDRKGTLGSHVPKRE